jgi:hypothetical protein
MCIMLKIKRNKYMKIRPKLVRVIDRNIAMMGLLN